MWKTASRFRDLFGDDKSSPIPLRTAVVHPCSSDTLSSAVTLHRAGILDVILVGPMDKIKAIALRDNLDLDSVRIESVAHSHAAAARSCQIACSHEVDALMKGSLHSDELLSAVLASSLRTDRWMSHSYVLDIPAYERLLIVTDAAINIRPTLDEKVSICKNAIDLSRALGVKRPRIAVVAAVETVNTGMPATMDAASLAMMASRGQLVGAIIDGPLAFDNAINMAAAKVKHIKSPVAGQADILLVPNIEAGNMLAKALIHFANANAAGIVLGASVPIILTSRSDPANVRMASAKLAKILTAHRRVCGGNPTNQARTQSLVDGLP